MQKAASSRHVVRGSDEPLAQIGAMLDRVRGGSASAAVLIEGAAGMGKTRLLEEVVTMAGELQLQRA